jgi:hypothetical protein
MQRSKTVIVEDVYGENEDAPSQKHDNLKAKVAFK